MVVREVMQNGPAALPGFLDCADEMMYAYLISAGSGAFKNIHETQGSDVTHLMNAVDLQRRLWQKMRVSSLLML